MTTRAQRKGEKVGTMHHQRIKIIESNDSRNLESAVNCFIKDLDRAPLEIKFGTFNKCHADSKTPRPEHIVYITYIENE